MLIISHHPFLFMVQCFIINYNQQVNTASDYAFLQITGRGAVLGRGD